MLQSQGQKGQKRPSKGPKEIEYSIKREITVSGLFILHSTECLRQLCIKVAFNAEAKEGQ